MTCTTLPKRTVRVRTRPASVTVVRSIGTAAIAPRAPRRPEWSLLYAIVPLVCAALAAAEFFVPEGLARTVAELLAVGAGIALARLWLGCNRVALAQVQGRSGTEEQGAPRQSIREATR